MRRQDRDVAPIGGYSRAAGRLHGPILLNRIFQSNSFESCFSWQLFEESGKKRRKVEDFSDVLAYIELLKETGGVMGRTVVGVIAGYLGIGALVAFTDMLFAAFVPGWKQMAHPPLYYFAISLVTDFLYSIAGGYICAVIAKSRWKSATVALIVMGEVIGVVSQALLWKTVPHWFGIGLLIVYPLGVWIGSRWGEEPVAVTA
jgi:hypothetical protein